MKVLARHGYIQKGTEVELIPEVRPANANSQEQNLYRARLGDLSRKQSVVWLHDNGAYSLSGLLDKLGAEHGVQAVAKTARNWRRVGHTECLWDEAERLLKQEELASSESVQVCRDDDKKSVGPSTQGVRPFGHSVTRLLHWMGLHNWTFHEASNVLRGFGLDNVNESTIRTGLTDGRNPKYSRPAEVTEDQASQLEAKGSAVSG